MSVSHMSIHWDCSEPGPEAEGPGVKVDVVLHEGGDEVVRVVVQGLHPEGEGVSVRCPHQVKKKKSSVGKGYSCAKYF